MNKKKYVLIQFNFKSFHQKLIEKNLIKIIKKAKLMNIYTKGIIRLPLRIKRFTVLRSPHVYKKSREQFELKTHHRMFVALFDFNNINDKKKAKLLINFAKSCSGSLQLKITYKTLYSNQNLLKSYGI